MVIRRLPTVALRALFLTLDKHARSVALDVIVKIWLELYRREHCNAEGGEA